MDKAETGTAAKQVRDRHNTLGVTLREHNSAYLCVTLHASHSVCHTPSDESDESDDRGCRKRAAGGAMVLRKICLWPQRVPYIYICIYIHIHIQIQIHTHTRMITYAFTETYT